MDKRASIAAVWVLSLMLVEIGVAIFEAGEDKVVVDVEEVEKLTE